MGKRSYCSSMSLSISESLRVSNRGYIMEKGAIVFEGPSHELRESPVTREKLGV